METPPTKSRPDPLETDPEAQAKLDERKAKREQQRSDMKKQMAKDRSRFKEGLPTSPIANDARRAEEVANFEPTDPSELEPKSPPPSESPRNSVVSKEEGINVTSYE